MTTKKYPILGLHCTGCAAAAQKALEHAQGVVSAKVDFLSRTAEITFQEDKTSPEELRKVADRAGFNLSI